MRHKVLLVRFSHEAIQRGDCRPGADWQGWGGGPASVGSGGGMKCERRPRGLLRVVSAGRVLLLHLNTAPRG